MLWLVNRVALNELYGVNLTVRSNRSGFAFWYRYRRFSSRVVWLSLAVMVKNHYAFEAGGHGYSGSVNILGGACRIRDFVDLISRIQLHFLRATNLNIQLSQPASGALTMHSP
jgi:hypothetical protein